MKPGIHGLTAEERQWLRDLCKGSTQEDARVPVAAPRYVIDNLVSKRLVAAAEKAYEVTPAGLAEALRTLK